MKLTQKVKISKRVFAQNIDDEMVLLDTTTQNYFGLDGVGSVMWQTIEEKIVIQDILDTLLEYYEVEEDILKRDLFIFIDSLVNSQLLEVVE